VEVPGGGILDFLLFREDPTFNSDFVNVVCCSSKLQIIVEKGGVFVPRVEPKAS